ncbi:MAG: sulfur carrier protein ThiS [Verrucomicrobiota bacterium]|nr:sulfur carrier protein ThiS [Verrucomicrobiota bacterium]
MQIKINGKEKSVDSEISLSGLLDKYNLESASVMVEVNECVIPETAYCQTKLQPGDCLELVEFVAGG